MTDDLAARLVDGQVLATDSPHFNLQYLVKIWLLDFDYTDKLMI